MASRYLVRNLSLPLVSDNSISTILYVLRQLFTFVRKGVITTTQWYDIQEVVAAFHCSTDAAKQSAMKKLIEQFDKIPLEVNEGSVCKYSNTYRDFRGFFRKGSRGNSYSYF